MADAGMMAGGVIAVRHATGADAATCAAIVNDWIDATPWMPRVHTHEAVVAFYRNVVIGRREVLVAGAPVDGFLALDEEAALVTALYVATPGRGIGRALLDAARRGRARLELWTFVANEGARRFYAREGFREVRRTPGENEEGLPDILLRWERAG